METAGLNRRISRQVALGGVMVGGDAPVSIQSMLNTKTTDVVGSLKQIHQLFDLGCQIIRLAVPDMESAAALEIICAESPMPVVADIHFDADLALTAIRNGIAAVRINPGNLKSNRLKELAEKAGEHNVVIRVGANSGSVKPSLLQKLRHILPEDDAMAAALSQSALEQCRLLEQYGFKNIKVSLKASSVPCCVKAYRKFAAETDYPLHLGITEAGIPSRGIVKSAVGIGALLLDGIGDTIRVSLTADPIEEVIVALRILEACELREAMPQIVSCPTCGRTEIDLINTANRVESLVADIKSQGKTILLKKIAVMGCSVNGPGEARDADLGIAGAKNGKVVLFRFGETIGSYDESQGFELLKLEILKFTK